MKEEKHYDPNIFEVQVRLNVMVTASNSEHAVERVRELLKERITQYTHPEDTPPKFRVIGLVNNWLLVDAKRRTFIERHTLNERNTARPTEHTEETSEKDSL